LFLIWPWIFSFPDSDEMTSFNALAVSLAPAGAGV
jgi:hypothetical protein